MGTHSRGLFHLGVGSVCHLPQASLATLVLAASQFGKALASTISVLSNILETGTATQPIAQDQPLEILILHRNEDILLHIFRAR